MATKYLDSEGVKTLWGKTKEYANARKTEVLNQKGVANGFASLDANGRVPLAQLGNLDTSLYVIPADNKLPTTGQKTNKIYLIKDNSETNNVYTEYIYVNNAWEMLGKFAVKVDLSPYATNADMIAGLGKKVNKESGKGLSTNDFTTALLNKLNGIADGATKVTVDSALNANSTNPVQNKAVMTELDKKANSSALANYVPTSRISTTRISAPDTNILTKKASDESYIMRGGDNVNGIFNFNQDEAGFSVTIDSTDGLTVTANDNHDMTIYSHGFINANGNILNLPFEDGNLALQSQIPDISGKVDKVTGKGLSTNDYTTTEKNKLAGIAEGATKVTVEAALNANSTNAVQNGIVAKSISAINTNITSINTTLGNKLNASDIAAITSTELAEILK